jgi:hypothetical protein
MGLLGFRVSRAHSPGCEADTERGEPGRTVAVICQRFGICQQWPQSHPVQLCHSSRMAEINQDAGGGLFSVSTVCVGIKADCPVSCSVLAGSVDAAIIAMIAVTILSHKLQAGVAGHLL